MEEKEILPEAVCCTSVLVLVQFQMAFQSSADGLVGSEKPFWAGLHTSSLVLKVVYIYTQHTVVN